MRIRFQLIEVEHIVDGQIDPTFSGDRGNFTALGGKLQYQSLCQPQQLDPNGTCLYGEDPFNNQMRQMWEQTNRQQDFVWCGQVILNDFIILGNTGLLLDFDRGVALVGAHVNWGIDFARWYLGQYMKRNRDLAWCDGEDAFILDVDVASIAEEPAPGLFFASPGQNVFGHWILDFVPRLYLARHMAQEWWQCLYFGEVLTWADHFLRAFNVERSTIRILPDRFLTRFPSIAMPSGVKQGFRVSQPANQRAWRHFKRYVELSGFDAETKPEGPSAPRIFISRRTWGAQRAISNCARLEELAVDRGYTVIRPEQYSIPEQARIMRAARIVVGEDGSGLHNIMFAERNCTLGVISVPDRINLWHMAFCQSMDHRLSYFPTVMYPDGTRIADEAEYSVFLDRLEHISRFASPSINVVSSAAAYEARILVTDHCSL